MTVLSPRDAWAVGFGLDSGGTDQTLTEHWNGSTRTVVPSPNAAGLDNILNGVRAESPTDIWAAQVASPHPGTNGELASVAPTSASNVWAVGTFFNGTAEQTLATHCC